MTFNEHEIGAPSEGRPGKYHITFILLANPPTPIPLLFLPLLLHYPSFSLSLTFSVLSSKSLLKKLIEKNKNIPLEMRVRLTPTCGPRASGRPRVSFPHDDQQRVQAGWLSAVNGGEDPVGNAGAEGVGAAWQSGEGPTSVRLCLPGLGKAFCHQRASGPCASR